MAIGQVVFYLSDKGYGYIRLADTREEFHFRRKHLLEPVHAGSWVQFELRQNKQGWFADAIRLLDRT